MSVINCYYCPGTEVEDIVEDILREVDHTDTGKRVIVCGDFNCRIDIPNLDARGDSLATGLATKGLALCSSPLPHTFVGMNGKSTIDLVFSNVSNRLLKYSIEVEKDSSASRDHRQVHSSWLLKSNNCGSVPFNRKREVDLAKLSHLAARTEEEVGLLLAKNLISEAVNLLNHRILSCTANKARGKPVFKRWFDSECRDFRRHSISLKWLGHPDAKKASIEYHRLCKRKFAEYEERTICDRLLRAEANPFRLARSASPASPKLYPALP